MGTRAECRTQHLPPQPNHARARENDQRKVGAAVIWQLTLSLSLACTGSGSSEPITPTKKAPGAMPTALLE